jgi:hypothetical protein
VWNTPLRNCCSPTAQTSFGETAVAENRMSRCVLSFGDLLMCQAEPFQASIRPWALKALFSATPTAHALPRVAATPNSVL